jgi:prepilin-type N-terminal cleavage/methylation domain-containing protein
MAAFAHLISDSLRRRNIIMYRRRGFTLVELLVVIAIIALLMSILMPALGRVRKQAKLVMCQSNLKQLSNACEMYNGDNNGHFWEGWQGLPNCPCGGIDCSHWWMNALKPYYQDPHVCLCPMAVKTGWEVDRVFYSEGGSTFLAWSAHGWLGPEGSVYGSYGVNGYVEHNQCEDNDPFPLVRWRQAGVKNAGNIPLLLDAPWIDTWPTEFDNPADVDDENWSLGSQMARFMKNRHDGGIDCLFVDYSVRRIGLKEMYILKWNREFRTDGPWTLAGGVTRSDWEGAGTGWMKDFKDY